MLLVLASGCRAPDRPKAEAFPWKTIHVATTGDDKNPGTAEKPVKTIAKAVSRARPGTVIRIRTGTYDDRVDFSADGTSSAPIVVEPDGEGRVVLARGFRVTGDYNVIRRLVVTPGESAIESLSAEVSKDSFHPWTLGQIQVTGNSNLLEGVVHHDREGLTPPGIPGLAFVTGSNNTVKDLDLHHANGVSFAGYQSGEPEGSGEHNSVIGGTVHHTQGMLFNIGADYATVKGVDMHDPGQYGDGGNACDGINVSGSNIKIQNNRIYNIFRRYQSQHTDAIQWWNKADDLLIEGNSFGSYRRFTTDAGTTFYDEGHIQWETYGANSITGEKGMSSHRVIIRNNVFINAGEYFAINSAPSQVIDGAANDWRIVNNTFRCPQGIRQDLGSQAHGWVIAGNIFCSDGPDYKGADWTIDYNAYTGSKSPQDGPHSMAYVDPKFVKDDVSKAARYGLKGDWSLRAGSPLISAGSKRYSPKRDQEGRKRRGAPDIGALEYTPR